MPTDSPLTARDFFGWVDRPENVGKRWELVGGVPAELVSWPKSCELVHVQIAKLFVDYVIRQHVGSVAFMGDGVITQRGPGTVRCPAVMVFTGPTLIDDFPPRYTTEVPQLVVDFYPPGDSYGRVMKRITDYVRFGISLVWLVEPDEQAVSVYELGRFPRVFCAPDELTGFDALPDLCLHVRELFALPGQPTTELPRKGTR